MASHDEVGQTRVEGLSPAEAAAKSAASPSRRSKVIRFTTILAAGLALGLVGILIALLLFGDEINVDASDDASAVVLLGEPQKVGWPPVVDAWLLAEEVKPLQRYLEAATGQPMPITIQKDYDATSQALLDGELDYAVLPPYLYIKTKRANPRITPLAIKEFDGAAGSDGVLIVRMNSDYNTLEDLEGKKFCFPDKNSTSGHMLPRAFISRAGYDPDEFIGSIHWSGDHFQVLRDLLAEKCEAGATYTGSLLPADNLDIKVSQIRTFAVTGNIPQDVFVAGPNVSEEAREEVLEALLAFDPVKHVGAERSLGDTQRITGFVAADDLQWDHLRKAIGPGMPDAVPTAVNGSDGGGSAEPPEE